MSADTLAPRTVLVTGATGFIGRHVVPALLRRGDDVVALVRDPGGAVTGDGLRIVQGDIADPRAVAAAVTGADAIVHLAAATDSSDPSWAHRVNVHGTRLMLDAASDAGVRRLVALSTVTVARDRVGPYGQTKRQMEQLVLAAGIPATVLRPSLVYGPGDRGLFARMAALTRSLPVVPVVGRGRQIIQPVHVDDVVEAILCCLDRDDLAGRCIDVVGPDDVTTDVLLLRLQRSLGVRRRLVHVPVPLALAGARLLQAVTSNPPITIDNVIGADRPTPTDRGPARQELGLAGRPLDEGLPTILDPAPPWTDRNGQRPLRVAVVGLGKMGLAHTALLAALPGARVAALVDPDRAQARSLRGLGFEAPAFADLEDAIAATRPDAAIIATPPHTHERLVAVAAAELVAVLVEKPLAHTLAAAHAIARTVAAAGVTATCGYTLAHAPAFEKARSLLSSGALGEIRSFEASMVLGQVLGPKRGWMYDPERSGGGVLPNLASHLLFLLQWYFGAATEVSATLRSLHTSVDDEADLRIRFTAGVEGTVRTSWSVPGLSRSRTRIRVEGANGTLQVDGGALELQLRLSRGGLPAGRTVIRAAALPHPARFELGGEAYAREDEDFLDALRDGRAPLVSIPDAVRVQAIMDAAYRSAASESAPAPVAAHEPSTAVATS